MNGYDHNRDEDCTVGDDGCCVECGVSHVDTCGTCGGHGFHRGGCVESDACCEVCEEADGEVCPTCRTTLCPSCAATPEHGDLHALHAEVAS